MPTIRKLSIQNFRSIEGPIELRFPQGMPLVLIGENNAGKSNIIRAFNMVLGQGWSGSHDPEDHDFYKRERDREIEICASFDPADLLAEQYSKAIWSFGMEAAGETAHFVTPSRFSGRKSDNMSNAIKASCVCVVIEADRNLNYQLSYASKYTFLSRLMHEFHKALREDEATVKHLEGLFEEVRQRFESIQPFAVFATSLKEQLASFSGAMTHRLEVDFQAYNPVNFFHALRLHASEGGNPRTLDELGTGEQQILALSFAYAFATAFHKGMILVIEEPEAHLHPLAQQWLSKRIRDMCVDGLQIVITTHSAHFIDLLGLEGLVVVRKGEGGTRVVQLSPQQLVTHCVATGAPAERTTPSGILPFYSASATPQILEGFFAKLVVLVEGPSEALALPIFLEKIGFLTSKEGVAIIPVGGKGNLAKWYRLFGAYDIPVYVVFDNDGRKDDTVGIKRSDALRATGLPDDDFDRIFASEEWIVGDRYMVFPKDFETSLRAAFDGYEQQEQTAVSSGVEAKPFVARWVAQSLRPGSGGGWTKMHEFADTLRRLLPSPPATVQDSGRSPRPSTISRPAARPI